MSAVRQLNEAVSKVHVFAPYLERATGTLLDVGCGLGEAARRTSASLAVVGNDPHLRFFSHRGFRPMLAGASFAVEADLTNFGRGWRRRFYPLFGSGPSFVVRRGADVVP